MRKGKYVKGVMLSQKSLYILLVAVAALISLYFWALPPASFWRTIP